MVPIDKVLFRQHDGADVCEIHLPDRNNVAVFPANEVIAGTDPAQTYAQTYKAAFDAFKAGELQPFEIAAQEAAAAQAGTAEHRGLVSDVETTQSGDPAAKAKK